MLEWIFECSSSLRDFDFKSEHFGRHTATSGGPRVSLMQWRSIWGSRLGRRPLTIALPTRSSTAWAPVAMVDDKMVGGLVPEE